MIDPNVLYRPEPVDANIRVVRSDSSGQLLNDDSVITLLMTEHSSDYLYRGQLNRYYRPWPVETKASIPANAYMLESLIPSDYRGVEDIIRTTPDDDARLAYGDPVTHARVALILTGVSVLLEKDKTQEIENWYQNLPNPNTNYITSLGQHVELPSANMDLTYSPQVAWWFASHEWGGVYQSGEGVIYRISRPILEQAIDKYNRQQRNRAELIDISKDPHAVPALLTPRPTAQEGLTLTGGEVGEILLELIAFDAITAFVFQRDHSAYHRNTASIKPPIDPLVEFLKQARKGIWDYDWQAQLNNLLSHHNKPNLHAVTEQKFRTAVFDGYDGLKKLKKAAP